MDLLAELQERGFSPRLIQDRIAISPAHKLTDGDRAFIRQNREALLEALRSAVASPAVDTIYRVWDITLPTGQQIRMMSPVACTTSEALQAAQWRWPQSRVAPY